MSPKDKIVFLLFQYFYYIQFVEDGFDDYDMKSVDDYIYVLFDTMISLQFQVIHLRVFGIYVVLHVIYGRTYGEVAQYDGCFLREGSC